MLHILLSILFSCETSWQLQLSLLTPACCPCCGAVRPDTPVHIAHQAV